MSLEEGAALSGIDDVDGCSQISLLGDPSERNRSLQLLAHPGKPGCHVDILQHCATFVPGRYQNANYHIATRGDECVEGQNTGSKYYSDTGN
jgi:hypothetical protein